MAALLGAMLIMFGVFVAKKRKDEKAAKEAAEAAAAAEDDDDSTLSIVSDTASESVHVPGRPEIKTIHDAVREIRAQMASGASQSLRDEVRRFVKGKPDSTAALIKEWLATDVTKTVEDGPVDMDVEIQASEG